MPCGCYYFSRIPIKYFGTCTQTYNNPVIWILLLLTCLWLDRKILIITMRWMHKEGGFLHCKVFSEEGHMYLWITQDQAIQFQDAGSFHLPMELPCMLHLSLFYLFWLVESLLRLVHRSFLALLKFFPLEIGLKQGTSAYKAHAPALNYDPHATVPPLPNVVLFLPLPHGGEWEETKGCTQDTPLELWG